MYLKFTKLPQKDGKKTSVWKITNLDMAFILGYIKWHGPWRKYCFFPEGQTIWDNKCMQEVQDFVVEEMSKRKKK